MRLSRGIATLSIAAIAVLGLSACDSDDDTTGQGADPTATSASGDDGTDGQDVSTGGELTAEEFAARLTAAMLEAGSVSQSMTSTAQGQSVTMVADAEFTKNSQNIYGLMDMGMLGQFEMIVVDGQFYIGAGEASDGMFQQVDLTDPTDPIGAQFADLTDQLDPKASFAMLDGAVASVERTDESQDFDGDTAWKYLVTLDTQKVDWSAAGTDLTALGDDLPSELVYEYWVDGSDRAHLVTTTVAGVSVELAFTGWGEPKNITAPSPDQLTDSLF